MRFPLPSLPASSSGKSCSQRPHRRTPVCIDSQPSAPFILEFVLFHQLTLSLEGIRDGCLEEYRYFGGLSQTDEAFHEASEHLRNAWNAVFHILSEPNRDNIVRAWRERSKIASEGMQNWRSADAVVHGGFLSSLLRDLLLNLYVLNHGDSKGNPCPCALCDSFLKGAPIDSHIVSETILKKFAKESKVDSRIGLRTDGKKSTPSSQTAPILCRPCDTSSGTYEAKFAPLFEATVDSERGNCIAVKHDDWYLFVVASFMHRMLLTGVNFAGVLKFVPNSVCLLNFLLIPPFL